MAPAARECTSARNLVSVSSPYQALDEDNTRGIRPALLLAGLVEPHEYSRLGDFLMIVPIQFAVEVADDDMFGRDSPRTQSLNLLQSAGTGLCVS